MRNPANPSTVTGDPAATAEAMAYPLSRVDARRGRGYGVTKPRLRGWLHAVMFPVVLVAGGVLIAYAAPGRARWSAVVFVLSAAVLFGTSALYHRRSWGPTAHELLRRLDHSNIFVIIAGTYTPFAVCLLSPDQARQLLAVVWGGALLGVLFKMVWIGAPRWLYTPLYVALGWVAAFYMSPLLAAGGPLLVALMLLGGLLYTAGAVVYAIGRPDPSPGWFGFHEVFHACTVAAFGAHFAAAALAIAQVGP